MIAVVGSNYVAIVYGIWTLSFDDPEPVYPRPTGPQLVISVDSTLRRPNTIDDFSLMIVTLV